MVWHVDMREVGRWCAAVLGLVAALDVPLRASASDGPSAPNAPLEPTPPSPSGEPSQLGRPRIRIEASGPLASRLELRRLEPDPRSITGGQPRWTTVCAMPCDRTVDGTLGQRFVVGGPGVSPSRWFTLLDHRDTTTLVVRPGRRVASVFGWLASGIGIGAVVSKPVPSSSVPGSRSRSWGACSFGEVAPAFASVDRADTQAVESGDVCSFDERERDFVNGLLRFAGA